MTEVTLSPRDVQMLSPNSGGGIGIDGTQTVALVPREVELLSILRTLRDEQASEDVGPSHAASLAGHVGVLNPMSEAGASGIPRGLFYSGEHELASPQQQRERVMRAREAIAISRI